MSERAPHSPEHHARPSHEVAKRQHEAHKETMERGEHARHEHAERLDEIRLEAHEIAKPSHEFAKDHLDTPAEAESLGSVNHDLKDIAYQRTLKRTQRQLSPSARTFSKIVHHRVVESASEALGNTVARPSGVLAGGITAFLGSTIFLWLARHYGYEYNFLLFALLFVGGFAIGVLVELGLYLAARRSR